MEKHVKALKLCIVAKYRDKLVEKSDKIILPWYFPKFYLLSKPIHHFIDIVWKISLKFENSRYDKHDYYSFCFSRKTHTLSDNSNQYNYLYVVPEIVTITLQVLDNYYMRFSVTRGLENVMLQMCEN